jgi:hypothetical protein
VLDEGVSYRSLSWRIVGRRTVRALGRSALSPRYVLESRKSVWHFFYPPSGGLDSSAGVGQSAQNVRTEKHKKPGGAAGRVSAKYMPFAGAEKILASTFTCERKFFFGKFLICGAEFCFFHPCISKL